MPVAEIGSLPIGLSPLRPPGGDGPQ